MELFEHITFKDLVDIAAVAIIVYQILLIIKGTRAVQMLMGILALAILFWGSFVYQLNALYWLLENFFASFIVFFIVIFQDQIRATLSNIGGGKNLIFKRDAPRQTTIDEIVEVAFSLSKKQIGGLVVLERVNGLRNFVATGTALNAEIHCDLIYSIFDSKSPLHDGAIIISKNKIAAAGCFLPLSKNFEVDRHLGTRHRAALGVTEVSDAVAVVVSEETGDVSIAEHGIFTKTKTKSDMIKTLKSIMLDERGKH